MKYVRILGAVAAVGLCTGAAAPSSIPKGKFVEAYVREPMPPGFQVMVSELEGPIYTDANGKTLYMWPRHELRNGGTADMKGAASACEDVKFTENAGLMSPYPAGLELPELDSRPTCAQVWPAVIAGADAKPVGKFSLIKRRDGRMQWAYEGFVLYTSILDKKPGDTVGGSKTQARGGDTPAYRVPIAPPTDIPGQFAVEQENLGRQLTLVNGFIVYTYDKDGPNKSNCVGDCLKSWQPVLAPEVGYQARDEWTIVERLPGVKQWAFRKQPLYTYIGDTAPGQHKGIDTPGFRLVFTQVAPPPPKEFTEQETAGGIVLADSKGKSIYIYNCGDDAMDQLACDHPDTPQEYRYAVCGGNDPKRCLETFPYVIADKSAKGNAAWTTMDIDPATGHRAKAGQADALHVWAYRDRPVFTFVRDEKPGMVRAQSWGEFYGQRNGYKAFFLREEFQGR